MNPARDCDIILLSYENPDLLKECVRSVLASTRVKSRLIVVDNASRDPEVRRYLEEVRGNGNVEIEKVFSESNAGFAGGMNKGIRLSDAPFVCLLNNDCVVTGGWLEEMITVARMRDDIGLVNPQSSTFGSRPGKGSSPDEHASGLADKGAFVELGHAIGFACLVKREVIDRVGLLDEAYEGVCYEDTDLSLRAQKAGYIAVMAEGAYVFHHEQASRGSLEGKKGIYERNRRLFEKKWGKLLRVLFLEGDHAADKGLEHYDILKGLARERSIIDMWSGKELSPDIRHADIGVKVVPENFLSARVLWKVLTKKKKYDAVILEEGSLASFLGTLRFMHGAEVFTYNGGTALKSPSGGYDLAEAGSLAKHLRGA